MSANPARGRVTEPVVPLNDERPAFAGPSVRCGVSAAGQIFWTLTALGPLSPFSSS